jgi:hypothetical protein
MNIRCSGSPLSSWKSWIVQGWFDAAIFAESCIIGVCYLHVVIRQVRKHNSMKRAKRDIPHGGWYGVAIRWRHGATVVAACGNPAVSVVGHAHRYWIRRDKDVCNGRSCHRSCTIVLFESVASRKS